MAFLDSSVTLQASTFIPLRQPVLKKCLINHPVPKK
jgi:hypothetical protein